MSRPIHAGVLAAALLLAAAGCRSREVAPADPGAATGRCTRCHGGTESAGGAPPRSVKGETATSSRAVGAHTAHVSGGKRLAAPLGCEACHVEPDPAAPMAHVDGEAAVAFGNLGTKGGALAASWDPATATCTVYCHGASMPAAGGDATAPVWTTVDGTQADCGSCHGAPPPAPHPQRQDCARCHPGSMVLGAGLSGAALAPAAHVNGELETELDCTSCHGEEGRGGTPLQESAPPTDSTGGSDTALVGVGAHLTHVMGGAIAGPVACASCHVVPADPAHPDGVAALTFSGVAVEGDLAPAFEPGPNTCSSTWCHGGGISGGTLKTPAWTVVDGTQAACGTCHGAPPPVAPHTPGLTSCRVCHPGTVNADGTLNVAGGRHVNGEVEVNDVHPASWMLPTAHGYAANADLASCRECHGADLAGGETGISCNSCHGGTAWQTSCTFCHGEANRAANKAAPPVGTQGELATTNVAVGAHQAHLSGGALAGPVACTECHAVPVDLGHVDGTAALTFGPVATANGAAPTFTEQHTCSATWCHGGLLGGGSRTAPAWTAVGSGQAACGACHGLPPPAPHPQLARCRACHPDTIAEGGGIDVAGGHHVNGIVEKQTFHGSGWSVPSVHGLAANADLAGCEGCHGGDLSGGTAGIACADCHGAGWQSNCAFCHGDPGRAGSALLKAAPPQGTQDEVATTAVAVGAHQAHVTAGALSGGFGCDVCHTVPADLDHVDGIAGVAFSGVANAEAPAAAWDGATCTTYCHGASLAGGTDKTPAWTVVDGSQAACGTCHGVAPPAPHPQNPSCGKCHGGYLPGAVNLASHVNGALELDALTCASCHGDGDRAGTPLQQAAPPASTTGATATTTRGVGAHAAHVYGSRWSNGFACTECHVVPAQNLHADGQALATFAGATIANAGGTATAWNGTRCATGWCHGAGKSNGAGQVWDGSNEAPAWTGGPSQAGCGTCHASGTALRAPGSYHYTHRDIFCATCHGAGYTDATVDRATHVNGVIDQKGCDAAECHGGEFRGRRRGGASPG